jgi:alkylation response protein AidB-like acyl-CoA dehydrogenase
MDFTEPAEVAPIREAVRALCGRFGDAYWRSLEPDGHPSEFVAALTHDGWLAALIPEQYGGSGLPLATACAILEEICASGANAGACHAQMYTMGTLLRHGSDAQKSAYLPRIASGELRLQAFAVTEPDAGSDTTQIKTRAERTAGGGWCVNGQKIWTSRAEHSDLMVLLARTTPPGRGAQAHGRSLGVPARHERPWIFSSDQSNKDDDQPLHDGGVLRGSRAAGRRVDRRAGRGLSLHPRRHERRAHPDRLRVHRRLSLLPRPRRRLRE